MESIPYLYYLSVWVHILAAALWVGGMGFLAVVVVPVLRRPEMRSSAATLVMTTGMRFRSVGWAALAVLLVSGSINLYYRGVTWAGLGDTAFWQTPFGRALFIKLALFAVILSLSALHDFWIGPKAAQLWQNSPESMQAQAFRKRASWFGRINMLLAMAVVFFAVALARGGWG